MTISNGIITLEDAKASIYGNTGTAPTDNDSDIEKYVEAATLVIERITGPVVERDETYTFNGGSPVVVLPARVSEVVSVAVDGVATTAFTADLNAGLLYAFGRFSYGVQNVVVVATVGYPNDEYPENVVLAARELVRFWWQQGRQANRPGVAEQVSSSPATPMNFLVPNRVMELLQASPNLGGFA